MGEEKPQLAGKALWVGQGSEILAGRLGRADGAGQASGGGGNSYTRGMAFLLELGAVSLTANCSEEKQSSWLM
jgi:hypothetical protein